MNEAIIQVDGVARGNPGPAAIAAIIKDNNRNIIVTTSKRIGISTNNEAEYKAVILGLEKAISLSVGLIEIHSDSEVVVRQISGKYCINEPNLKLLHQRVKHLEPYFDVLVIKYIPRKQNNEADQLAKKTLNLVRHIDYAQVCQLVLVIKQSKKEADDISRLHKLTDILKFFPGLDSVTLRCKANDKEFILNLPSVHVHYCYELREELKKILGKREIIVKPLREETQL